MTGNKYGLDMAPERLSSNDGQREIQFDYDNQCWIIDGLYQNCNHPPRMDASCRKFCFGRLHAGERAPSIH